MERNFQSVLSISASGNKNWGKNFSVSGDILAERYALFLVHKFEMTGFEEDVNKVLKDIFSIEECRSRIL
ncbi:MAG: class Ib ribonucleoside-diphosphate reductase assembly flavoprotein NrdI [Sphingobacterium cellulitidis]